MVILRWVNLGCRMINGIVIIIIRPMYGFYRFTISEIGIGWILRLYIGRPVKVGRGSVDYMAWKPGKVFSKPCRWFYSPSGSKAILQVRFGGKWMDTTVRKHRGR